VRNVAIFCTLCLFTLPALASEPALQVEYTDDFADSYAELVTAPCSLPDGVASLPEERTESRLSRWRAILSQTDPTVVPYDQAVACLAFDGPDGARRTVRARVFRTIRVQWLNDRLVAIETDLGHAVSVLQILDLDQGRWVYQLGERYFWPER